MPEVQGNCIYCTSAVNLNRGQGDHVVPAALGRFRNEFVFRRICRKCNSHLGKCEEQVLRCAPESLIRRMVAPAVGRKKRSKGWVGSNGMAPPKSTIDHGTHRELVDHAVGDPRNVVPVDQLVITDGKGKEFHVRLHPKMTVDQLRAKIEILGIKPENRSYLHADEAAFPKYVELLRQISPEFRVVEGQGREGGVHRVQGQTMFTFHSDYWRALAKICFHYYLLNTRRGLRGDEPIFVELRRFIMEGGDRDTFFTKPAVRFAMPFRELADETVIVPPNWMHVLAADETQKSATAMVSLFMGPDRVAPIYTVNLGRFETELILPKAGFAHSYVYRHEQNAGEFAGDVVADSWTWLR